MAGRCDTSWRCGFDGCLESDEAPKRVPPDEAPFDIEGDRAQEVRAIATAFGAVAFFATGLIVTAIFRGSVECRDFALITATVAAWLAAGGLSRGYRVWSPGLLALTYAVGFVAYCNLIRPAGLFPDGALAMLGIAPVAYFVSSLFPVARRPFAGRRLLLGVVALGVVFFEVSLQPAPKPKFTCKGHHEVAQQVVF